MRTLAIALLALTFACAGAEPASTTRAELLLALSAADGFDVVAVRFEATAASGAEWSREVALEPAEHAPPDGSDRRFATASALLAAGTYEIRAVPLGGGGEASLVCAAATGLVTLAAGATVSATLVSACGGRADTESDPGRPRIHAVVLEPGRTLCAGEVLSVRAEVLDPDGDPLRLAWRIAEGPAELACLASSGDQAGFAAAEPGRYVLELSVADASATTTLDFDVTVSACGAAPECAADGVVARFPDAELSAGCTCFEPCRAVGETLVDFDTDAGGAALATGTVVTHQWEPLGLAFGFATASPLSAGVLFDTAAPTPGHKDLGAPNRAFGGPGIGIEGGSAGPGGNRVPLGRVLVLAEKLVDRDGDGRADVPDPARLGGVMTLTFARPVKLRSLTLLDVDLRGVDESASHLVVTHADATVTVWPIPALGDNSAQDLVLDAEHVSEVAIHIRARMARQPADAALAAVRFCAEP